MHSIPTHSPSNVAALDAPDPAAGNACHVFGIQFAGPKDVLYIRFQHGPRGEPGSKPGAFDDDLLAILEARLAGFQAGTYACPENQAALDAIRAARAALAERVARRMAQGVLGANAQHETGA